MPSQSLATFFDELVYQTILSRRSLSRVQGISDCAFRALMYISHQMNGATVSETATFLCVTRPRTSTVVEELVQRKLIKRQQGSDRRQSNLYLTEEGCQAVAELHQAHLLIAQTIIEAFDDVSQDRVSEVATRCTNVLRELRS